MLDKNVVRFTREGMQQENVSTGESHALTVSDYGKELKYRDGEFLYDEESRSQPYARSAHAGAPRRAGTSGRSGAFFFSDRNAPRLRANVRHTGSNKNGVFSAAVSQWQHRRMANSVQMIPDATAQSTRQLQRMADSSYGDEQAQEKPAIPMPALRRSSGLRMWRRKKQAQKAAQASAKASSEAVKTTVRAAWMAGKAATDVASAPARVPIAIVVALVIILVLLIIIIGSMFSSCGTGQQQSSNVPPAVENYRSTVSMYAVQFGMTDYVDLTLAVMAQESGGTGLDPMQAAEGEFNTKYPKKPNGITDPQYSIWCGVQELKKALDLAGCTSPYDLEKVKLALQGYNYGTGWFSFAGGVYTAEKARQFSDKMAAQMGWSRYGDPDYVPHVLRYYRFASVVPGTGLFTWPVPGHTTLSSPYGQREGEFHKGIDINDGSISGSPIIAAADGTVTRAADGYGTGHIGSTDGGGWGNHAYIDHGNGYVTIYGHMSRCIVKIGDHVNAGQVIGYVGSSGSSTGPHLHFQVMLNNEPTNPMQFFNA